MWLWVRLVCPWLQAGLPANGVREAESVARKFQLQLRDMERTVASKDEILNRLMHQTALSEKVSCPPL